MDDQRKLLKQLQKRLGHRFRDPSLLTEALTHPSYLQEGPEGAASNQRLEFLGDSVLQLVLTEELFRRFPAEREGVLSRWRAMLTKGQFLSGLAGELGLKECLLMSHSEAQAGGRSRPAALEDAAEAIIGAIYLDRGLKAARQAILSWYGDLAKRLQGLDGAENPKGRLQELIQPDHGNSALSYRVVEMKGEPHEREFEVEVLLNGASIGSGRGSSKKEAEEQAARLALQQLNGVSG